MSKLADKLIQENKRSNARTLDLANCGLSEIPTDVCELLWLETLHFSASRRNFESGELVKSANEGPANEPLIGLGILKTLSNLRTLTLAAGEPILPLGHLSGLQLLDLRETPIRDVTPLAALSALQSLDLRHTLVRDITPLAKLSALRSLDLSHTLVSDVTPLAKLSALQSLDLRVTPVSDITFLAKLSALQSLDLSDAPVRDLTPLAALSTLQSLSLFGTRVSDVTPLAKLSALRSLDLRDTQVRDLSALLDLIRALPLHWRSRRGSGEIGIFVPDWPVGPPPEIVQQGKEAVVSYYAERGKSGVEKLYEAKMLIVGEGGAGKTSLLRRLYDPEAPMPGEDEGTRGIAIYRHAFKLKDGSTFRLNVWDFGGQEIYHAIQQFFLTHRSLYVLVDDTRKDDRWVQDPLFLKWLGMVELFGGGSPVLIFQNERGGRSKPIDFDSIRSRYSNVREQYQGDLAKPGAVDRLRDAIEYHAAKLNHVGEELPAPWIKVRADLEELAKAKHHITQQDYFDIYRRHLEFDKTKALILSQYLHDLGVCLHFQKDLRLSGTVILQNEWATEAVFQILDDEGVKKKFGRFGEEDCGRIWGDSVYAGKHAELLALMQNFELCYELPDKTPREWLAPQLLPPGKPEETKGWNKQGDLVLRYRYEFLPRGMISRLTVRMHRFVRRPAMAWMTGVLFERGEDTKGLVELMPDGKEVEIRAGGTEAIGLLSAISFDLDALNESFDSLKGKVVRMVPCACVTCSKAETPRFYNHSDLVKRIEKGAFLVQCESSYQQLDARQLLYRLPTWAKSAQGTDQEVLRIFLASSSELLDERNDLELYLRQQNDELRRQGKYLDIVRCENFLNAMSKTGIQDEYNKAWETATYLSAFFLRRSGNIQRKNSKRHGIFFEKVVSRRFLSTLKQQQ